MYMYIGDTIIMYFVAQDAAQSVSALTHLFLFIFFLVFCKIVIVKMSGTLATHTQMDSYREKKKTIQSVLLCRN